MSRFRDGEKKEKSGFEAGEEGDEWTALAELAA